MDGNFISIEITLILEKWKQLVLQELLLLEQIFVTGEYDESFCSQM